MTYTITRILLPRFWGPWVTGCATVPGDPYYDAPRYPVYEQPGYIYKPRAAAGVPGPARVPRARRDLFGPTARRTTRRT